MIADMKVKMQNPLNPTVHSPKESSRRGLFVRMAALQRGVAYSDWIFESEVLR